ncbi:hypothetical protein CKW48_21665, partial [Bordetella pertussis]
EFALVGLAASAVGCLLGYAVHQGLVLALGQLIDTSLPAPWNSRWWGWRPRPSAACWAMRCIRGWCWRWAS